MSINTSMIISTKIDVEDYILMKSTMKLLSNVYDNMMRDESEIISMSTGEVISREDISKALGVISGILENDEWKYTP